VHVGCTGTTSRAFTSGLDVRIAGWHCYKRHVRPVECGNQICVSGSQWNSWNRLFVSRPPLNQRRPCLSHERLLAGVDCVQPTERAEIHLAEDIPRQGDQFLEQYTARFALKDAAATDEAPIRFELLTNRLVYKLVLEGPSPLFLRRHWIQLLLLLI
jgi:hypothetical protein